MSRIPMMVEIDEAELALRLAGWVIGATPPPPGMSAVEALDDLEEAWNAGKRGPFPFRALAIIATEYVMAQFGAARMLQ